MAVTFPLILPTTKRPTCASFKAEEFTSFLTKLNGREGTFLMGDPNGATPRGLADGAPGTPLVNGGSQVGDTLVCDGAPNGVTGYLLEGDYVQLGTVGTSRLYKVLDDVDSDGSGNFTLNIWPDLRTSPSNDEVLIVENAVSVFRLAANASMWDLQPGVFYSISLSAIEAL